MNLIPHETLSNSEQRMLGAKFISPGKYRVDAAKLVEQVNAGYIEGYSQNRGGKRGLPRLDPPLVRRIKENLQPMILGDFTFARKGNGSKGFVQADAHNRMEALRQLHNEGGLPKDMTVIAVFTDSDHHIDAYTGKNEQRAHTSSNKYKNADLYYGSHLRRIGEVLYGQIDYTTGDFPVEFWRLANNLAYCIEAFRQKVDLNRSSFFRLFSLRQKCKNTANVSVASMQKDVLSQKKIEIIAEAVGWWLDIIDEVGDTMDLATREVMKSKSFAGLMILQYLKGTRLGKMRPQTVAERIKARNAILYNNAVALTAGAQDRSERAEEVVLSALEKRLPPGYAMKNAA